VVLKDRRKAICEFVLKILNSFKLLDNYLIDGSFNNIKNILSVIEEANNEKVQQLMQRAAS
jgi:hypothetical protein